MQRNLGTGERLLRGVAGLMILGLYGALTPPLQYLTLIGLVPLGTAITGFCPLYAWLGRGRGPSQSGGAR